MLVARYCRLPPRPSYARYAGAARDDYPEDFVDDAFDDVSDDVFDDVVERGEPGGAYPGEPDADYPDFSRAGQPAAATPPPTGGGHRSQWRGGHRSEGGRRGVSIGVVAALVVVVVVVATVILWRFFGDALSHRSHTAATRCIGAKENVAVIADASIADRVQQFGDRYNESATPVGDHCMQVSVKPPAPMPSSTGSSATGRRSSATGRRCGYRAARCRRHGSRQRSDSKRSAIAVHWSRHRC
ncbi:hypothetical protein I553_6463 [Mycobacterium xenopi 4042]|uniref:Uncharacterized protein n=1 Tax=Mycobacterium xenopi 4042 TaxID=1299334 RepID=X8BH78_MYCXE|nr:hypothetical protein I553_6463 [Mycobacterium xenopi 4042]